MKRLEQYIPFAIDVVEDLFLKDESKVDSEFDNIASRFGVSVRQLGLKTAVIAFSPNSVDSVTKKSEKKKALITKAILRIIQLHEKGYCSDDDTLRKFILAEPDNPLHKPKILDAAVALKMALRLYIENPKEQINDKDINNKEKK